MIGVDVKGWEVFRLFVNRDPKTGAKRQPFMHSLVPAPSADRSEDDPAGGRFDLRSPRGTCYLSNARLGAWVEVFRGARLVDRRDARLRRMMQSRVPRRLVLADATSRSAIADGVILDLHAGSNRIETQRFAAAIDADPAFRGIQAWARHDPSTSAHTIALFDDEGEHLPYGWRWNLTMTEPLDDFELLTELAACGLGVAGVPRDLPVVKPAGHVLGADRS
ncbi:MAG: hypothetical protein ACOYO9_10000 [Candidatus Nanopelagicales bacterium]